MPISARLDKETEETLKKTARHLGISKSRLVKESIKEYCKKMAEEKKKTPWEIYQSIHMPGGSGHGRRVLSGKETMRKTLEEKRKRWSL